MSRNVDHRRHARRHPIPGRTVAFACALMASLLASNVLARDSDRNKPMDIDAGRQVGTFSADSVNTLSGGVHITQGSLDITSSTAKITLAGGEPVRAVFSGGPAVFKQLMDDGTPMNARANNVDYNLDTEVVVFTGDVQLKQPTGSLSGQRVVYNLKTSSIEGGGEGNGRVKMRILPKGAKAGSNPAPASSTPADSDRAAEPGKDQN